MSKADIGTIEYVFAELQAIFPKWRELWPSEDALDAAKRSWSKTLVEQGINTSQLIEYGLKAARATGWARPPAAGQFCAWGWEGKQSAQGVPTLKQAQESILRRVRYPETQLKGVMYHILTELDWHRAKQASAEQLRDMVEAAWTTTIGLWKANRPLRQPQKAAAIEKKPRQFTVADKRAAKEALANLLSTMTVEKAEPKLAGQELVFSSDEQSAMNRAFAEAQQKLGDAR